MSICGEASPTGDTHPPPAEFTYCFEIVEFLDASEELFLRGVGGAEVNSEFSCALSFGIILFP